MTPLERLHALHDRTGHGLDDCTDVLFVDVRERIRELEAELETQRQNRLFQMGVSEGWKARAEKAEDALRAVKADRATWKARVAELEARVKWLEDPKNWVDEYGQLDEGRFAREREAD